MSAIEPERTEPFDIFAAWRELPPTDWQSMITSIVRQILSCNPTIHAVDTVFSELVDKVASPGLSNAIVNSEYDLRWETVHAATMLGWALHSTMHEAGIEDVGNDWARRAAEYAHIEAVPRRGAKLIIEPEDDGEPS